MKKSILLIVLIFCLFSSIGYSQSKKEIKKEKAKQHERIVDTLQDKISGVKFVDLGLSKAQEVFFINNSNSGDALILKGVIDYLKEIGLTVVVTQEQRDEIVKLSKSQCDYVNVTYNIGEFVSKFGAIGNYPFNFSFKFCDNSIYSFSTKISVNGLTNYSFLIKNTCNEYFPIKRKYNIEKRLKFANNEVIISSSDFSKYLDDSTAKKNIEGIYQLFSSDANTSKYSIGIYNSKDTLKVIYFNGTDFLDDWKEGEFKGYLISTLSESDYIVKWVSINKTILDGSITFVNKNAFEFKSITWGYNKGVDKFIRIK
jgi:hypothetical protein